MNDGIADCLFSGAGFEHVSDLGYEPRRATRAAPPTASHSKCQ